ncbi:MAG: hypothetical protein WCZ98_05515 [Sideroxydans sp.]
MKISYAFFLAALICPCLGSSGAWAEESTSSGLAQHHTMTPQEYEVYRARLQNQIEEASPRLPDKATGSGATEAAPDRADKPDTGYGQGYRARAERSDRAARTSDNRGGAMQRGGGRNR